jgi:DNA polymerase III epsilon subunit-like protein
MQVEVGLQLPGTLDDVRFAVVDVETSGLSVRSHRILQVAVVVVRADGTVLDQWSSYVRPRWRWFARMGPTHIHRIRRGDVRNAPTANAVLDELGRRVDGAVLAAHNLPFDWGFIARAAHRARTPLPSGPRLCTLQLARATATDPEASVALDTVRPSYRLGDLCARYGVELTRAHDALADAAATAELLPHLLRAAGVSTVEQLAQFVER